MDKKEILNQVINNLELPKGKSNDQVWGELQLKLKQQNSVPVKSIKPSLVRKAIPFMAAASVALAVMFLFPFKSESTAEFSTKSQEVKLVELEDGSEVILGANSQLTVSFSDEVRTVNLNGEAFFDVEKGIPFIVETAEGNVSVLGTSFNVNSRQHILDVKCFTGKVEVTTQKGASTLTKGLGINTLLDGVYAHSSVPKFGGSGDLIFDQQPLNSVLEDLKHYRGFNIINKSDFNPIISFEISNESITEISEVLGKITSLRVKVVGENKIELYK